MSNHLHKHNLLRTFAQRNVVVDLPPKLTDRLKLDEKNWQHDNFMELAVEFYTEEFAAGKMTKVLRRRLPKRRHER